MSNVAAFLCQSMKLVPLENAPDQYKPPQTCSLSGRCINQGYPVQKIFSGSTGDALGIANGNMFGVFSVEVATAFKRIRNVGGIIAFEDTCYFPAISRKNDKPCWSDLVRDIGNSRAGHRAVLVLSTSYQKRTWHRAQITTIGSNTSIYIYDTGRGVKKNVSIHWEHMLKALDFVEHVYTAGFSKAQIETGLQRARLYFDIEDAPRWERQLSAIRHTDEFLFAALIAQKKEN